MTLLTPNYSIPYPELTDPPNGPSELAALSLAADTAIAGVQTNLNATNTNLNTLQGPNANGHGLMTYGKSSGGALLGGTEVGVFYDTALDTCAEFSIAGNPSVVTVNTAGKIRLKGAVRLTTGGQGVTGYARLRIASSTSSGTNIKAETQMEWYPSCACNKTYVAEATFWSAAATTWTIYVLSANALSIDAANLVYNVVQAQWLGP